MKVAAALPSSIESDSFVDGPCAEPLLIASRAGIKLSKEYRGGDRSASVALQHSGLSSPSVTQLQISE